MRFSEVVNTELFSKYGVNQWFEMTHICDRINLYESSNGGNTYEDRNKIHFWQTG